MVPAYDYEDEILFESHDTQIRGVKRSPGVENCSHEKVNHSGRRRSPAALL